MYKLFKSLGGARAQLGGGGKSPLLLLNETLKSIVHVMGSMHKLHMCIINFGMQALGA